MKSKTAEKCISSQMAETLIQCVVVLYECSWKDSAALQALAKSSGCHPAAASKVSLLIYDNSSERQSPALGHLPFAEVAYSHSAANDGLAKAYNQALWMAKKARIEWLLLLDQDTAIPVDFLHAVSTTIEGQLPHDLCAIVPKLVQDGELLSPQRVGRFRNVPMNPSFSGVSSKRLTALNSGACLRVGAVVAAGRFPEKYWLDFLDHMMFYRLQSAAGRVLVLDLEIRHRLAQQHMGTEMTCGRQLNVLEAEWNFVRETGSGGGTFMHRLRLLKRAINLAIRLEDKDYARNALRAALQ